MNRVAREIIRSMIPRRRKALSPASWGRWFRIYDTFTGAWQQNVAPDLDTVLSYSAVLGCARLIAWDIGKLGIHLKKRSASGIWTPAASDQFTPVLKKPNPHQTAIKFIESWQISRLLRGNTYVLKVRDNGGRVRQLHVLDTFKCEPLISDSGEVFYRLNTDHLARIHEAQIIVPATEIIHDVYFAPDHPLVGMSPISACGLAAQQGLNIQTQSEKFFQNMARPSGMLTAPGTISDDTATRLKAEFQTKYGGENVGNIAVAGDGLEFKQFTMTAVDAQLIEQLRMTAENVCTAFGVPAYKVGVGDMPAHNNINALDQQYYSQTLQEPISEMQALLVEGLELPDMMTIHSDLEALLRMDILTQSKVYSERAKGGALAPDEWRAELGMEPVAGGATPYLQQQNYSLAALNSRDAKLQEEDTDIQQSVMNGAQVQAMQNLLVAAANGEMPPESAAVAIAAAFPLLDATTIDSMISPLLAVAPDDPPDDPPADDDEDVETMVTALLTRELQDVEYGS